MSEILSPILYQVGTGGILGFFAGYAVKKLMKILAVIVGLFALALIYLGYQGVINVNYGKLTEMIGGLTGDIGGASQVLHPIIASLPFGGSFAIGLVLGLKKG